MHRLIQTSRVAYQVMRLAWIAESIDLDVASFRYRCLLPAWSLSQRGYRSGIYCKGMPRPEDYDALIVVKNAAPSAIESARRFRALEKPVIVDLCDNVFVQGYLSRINPSLTAETLSNLGRYATAAVTPTATLARLVKSRMPHLGPVHVVPDGALTAATFGQLKSWLKGVAVERLDQSIMSTKRRSLKSLARSWVPEPLHHLVGLNGKSGVAGPWSSSGGIELPNDRARIVWFGKHGTRHGGAGMMLLQPLLPLLEKVHRHRPIELVVISNNFGKFIQLCEGTTIYARYERWTNRRTFLELDGAQIFLMPTADDPFSMCKSANRAVMALASNVPVVAAYLEDLEPLRRAIVLDDWALGIERYLFDETSRAGDLAAAKAIIDRVYSIDAIAGAWETLLHADRATHHLATPPVAIDPATAFGRGIGAPDGPANGGRAEWA